MRLRCEAVPGRACPALLPGHASRGSLREWGIRPTELNAGPTPVDVQGAYEPSITRFCHD